MPHLHLAATAAPIPLSPFVDKLHQFDLTQGNVTLPNTRSTDGTDANALHYLILSIDPSAHISRADGNLVVGVEPVLHEVVPAVFGAALVASHVANLLSGEKEPARHGCATASRGLSASLVPSYFPRS